MSHYDSVCKTCYEVTFSAATGQHYECKCPKEAPLRNSVWRVRYLGKYPKKKVQYVPNQFATRRQARSWCRNHQYEYEGLTIVGPKVTQVERFN